MTLKVILIESEDGYAASCPVLRGCHSQGRTQEEALENIRIAIREWLDAEADEHAQLNIIEMGNCSRGATLKRRCLPLGGASV